MAIELTESQLLDYMHCPLRYDARYRLKVVMKNHPSMNALLNKVASSFLLNLMNGRVLTTNQIKKKWDRICEENQEYITSKKCIEGIGNLMKMYHWAENKELCVADMEIQYTYMATSKDVLISGVVSNAVIPLKNGKFELLEFDFSPKYPDQAILDIRTKYSLNWFAMKEQYSNAELAGIHVHHVPSNKDWFTVRGRDDQKRLDASIKGIAECIQRKIFYPRENTFCSSCDMKNYCRAWHGKN